MKIGILGGGLSGLVMAYLLQRKLDIQEIDILEKEHVVGGLCRSFNVCGAKYDLGPHILFSKDEDLLNAMLAVMGNTNLLKCKRNNKIYFRDRFIKYPFENDLYNLPEMVRNYCLNTFLNNPYAQYNPESLLQFFLTTFGEGITNAYLRPYNEKIWKFDPAYMDISMVGRIPKPPAEDIIQSATGIPTEGHLHQLYFYYPQFGGIGALIDAFKGHFSNKITVKTDYDVTSIVRKDNRWCVNSVEDYDMVISTIPLSILHTIVTDVPIDVVTHAHELKSNSITVAALVVTEDNLKDYFTVMVPNRDVIFHRVSKLNAITPMAYPTLLVEITHRGIKLPPDEQILRQILADLMKVKFINSVKDCMFAQIQHVEYAYPLYDLSYRINVKIVKDYYENLPNFKLCGRFGEHEYLNMDGVVARCIEKVNNL